MFLNDDLIFLHLQKTAGTHVTDLLGQIAPGVNRDKHGRLDCDPAGRLIVGSVRNPWDWYVSLWAYGVAGKGDLAWYLTASWDRVARTLIKQGLKRPARAGELLARARAHLDKAPAEWRRLYATTDDPGLFREWLRRISSEEGRRWMTEGYDLMPMGREVGFCSYRFLYLYSDPAAWDREARTISGLAAARAFWERAGIARTMIRTEHLEADLRALVERIYPGRAGEIVFPQERTNRSRHRGAAAYYDAQTRDLVAEREALLIAQYGYEPPPLA